MYLEIDSKFKSPNVVTVVKLCILEWLGCVARMNGYWKAKQEQGAKTEKLDLSGWKMLNLAWEMLAYNEGEQELWTE